MEKFRNRSFMVLLYEDDITHEKALKKIMVSYDYVGILHNKDVNEDGELKKRHYHIVLRFKNAMWNTALAKELGIQLNYIQEVKKFDNALLYLLHYNDKDKAQYSIDEVFGNMKTRLNEIINKNEKSEGEKVVDLIAYIKEYNGRLSITDFAIYCAKNGYWAEFRRSASILLKIIEEKNNYFDKVKS